MRNFLYKIIILISSIMLSQSLELDFGWHNPQGSFDKYNNPGTSFRATYSNIGSKDHIKYDLSIQYLSFMSNTWTENTSYPMTVTHSEQSWGILYGPRIMSPTRSASIRPYFGFKGGVFLFSETMKYEWQNELDGWDIACLFFEVLDDDDEFDCLDQDNSFKNTLDSKFYLGAIFEIGANMKINNNVGLDYGVQYNIIPNLRAIDTDYSQNSDNQSLQVTQIARSINADYVTFYFGLYFNLNKNGVR